MLKKVVILLHIILFSSFCHANTSTQTDFKTDASHRVQKLLKNSSDLSSFLTTYSMRQYYKGHQYHLFWFDANGTKSMAIELINAALNDSVLKPISRKLFNLDEIIMRMSDIEASQTLDINKIVRTDFMITGIYDYYMRLVAQGSVDWKVFEDELEERNKDEKIIANWDRYLIYKNRRALLYKALKDENVYTAIDTVNYTFPNAKALAKALNSYEQIAKEGGYTQLPQFEELAKNDENRVVKVLRERLIQGGDLNTTECMVSEDTNITRDCLELFDTNVEMAVKVFQRNHGLLVDGVVGSETRVYLNITVEKKINQIRLNLERMRWLPRSLGKKYLLINITDYKLRIFDEGNISLEMPIVVGEPRNPTPIFSHELSSIILNPYWRVPNRIVKHEMVPKLVKDPSYLDGGDMRMHADWNESSDYYDIKSIDWSVYLENENEAEDFDVPMRFIQIPSNQNSLGRVKFMFPNKYAVYIHDTSEKKFFKYRKRAYSHGCIRVSKPDKLLETIAQDDENVDYDDAVEILQDNNKTKIALHQSIPVHMVYLTSWVNENGVVQFRDDIYSYDTMQLKLLNKAAITQ